MRILFGFVALGGLVFALCGCGSPDAEFAWSENTRNLIPAAQKTTKTYVQEQFGTPGKMVAWQRLPVKFGGVPGVIRGVSRSEEHEHIITGLMVDFRVPAMMARYDENLDGLLSLSEFPAELQQAITVEKFEEADQDDDGFLTPLELSRIRRVDSELFTTESVAPVDEDNYAELIGKELLFVDGRYAGQSTVVRNIDLENKMVEIWPPLSDQVEEGEPAVDVTNTNVIVDFGRTMRSGRHLYMRHCVHCHGVTGDGNGPTAQYLNPLPRDYRQGVFKFISTPADTVKRPSRDDLARILKHGIPGTYMPSFSMLLEQETADVIEYVRWLSMRGEYEGRLDVLLSEYTNQAVADEIRRQVATYEQDLRDGNVSKDKPPVTSASVRADIDKNLAEYLETDLPEDIDDEADRFAASWRDAELQANVIYPKIAKPPTTADSIARGRHLYLNKCAVCHGVTAEGDGENTRGYQKDPVTDIEYPQPGLFDIWGHPIKPRNLTTGIYRGGRRPLDLYRRIHQGIPGGGMQSFASAFTDEQIWDLVDYVMSIPIDGPFPHQNTAIAQGKPPAKPAASRVAKSEETPSENAE